VTSTAVDTALWDLGRASGVVSLVLLTIVVALGIVTRSGRPLPGLPRFAVSAVHRSASLLAVVFLVVHVVTLTFDPQSQLRWIDAVIPFGSNFKPLWTGLGALSLDLIVALVVTSLLRRRIGRRVWRAIHWTAYATWPFAVLHTIGAGTDFHRAWLEWILVSCGSVIVAIVGWRASSGFLDDSGRVPGTRLPTARTRPALETRVVGTRVVGTRGFR
jgi:methionine sulfoxide reductase heme-binding subunit